MTESTSNHGWTIPTVGGDENQWGQILNDFFDGELDRQVILEDTLANRPAADSTNVKLFLATDQRIVYFNDGSSWEAVYGLGRDGERIPGTSYYENVDFEEGTAGHDGVRVPSAVDLTVEDFEEGVLSDAFTNQSGYSVQSSVVLSGSHSLKGDGDDVRIISNDGLGTYPQPGDSGEFLVYLTDSRDLAQICILVESPTNPIEDSILFSANAEHDKIEISRRENNSDASSTMANADISNHLNETLRGEFTVGVSGDISYTLYDSADAELASVTHTVSDLPESGDLGFRTFNYGGATVIYYDAIKAVRRTREYLTETRKGTVELGGESVEPAGAVNAGPHESVLSDRAVHSHIRTDPSLAGGDDVALVDDVGGADMGVHAQADGEGFSYANRRAGALHEQARIDAALGLQRETSLINWAHGNDGSGFSQSHTGVPRVLQITHDGSGDYTYGWWTADVFVPFDLFDGPIRITWKNVTFTDNKRNNRPYFGLTEDAAGTGEPKSASNVISVDTKSFYITNTNNGDSDSNAGQNSELLDWTTPSDLTLVVDPDTDQMNVYHDGIFANSFTDPIASGVAWRPYFEGRDDGANSQGETYECEQVIVEVLN